MDCNSCKYKCSHNFSEDERVDINREYWGLGDNSKQLIYLSTVIKINPCHRKLNKDSRRSNTIDYSLKKRSVCKKFFCATLNITDGRLSVWKKKQESEEQYSDKRGRHGNQRTSDPDVVAKIHAHIKSFPVMESHYSRADTRKLFLASNLNIKEMFRLFLNSMGRFVCSTSTERSFVRITITVFTDPRKTVALRVSGTS